MERVEVTDDQLGLQPRGHDPVSPAIGADQVPARGIELPQQLVIEAAATHEHHKVVEDCDVGLGSSRLHGKETLSISWFVSLGCHGFPWLRVTH